MTRSYKRLEDKLDGVVPALEMGATIHVDRYVIPCTVVHVGTTDKRAPMVAVQVDSRGPEGFVRDENGEVLVFTYRKSGSWRQYGQGFKNGPWLELAVRRSKTAVAYDAGYPHAAPEDAVEGHAVAEDAVNTDAVKGHAVEHAVPHRHAVNDAVRSCGDAVKACGDAVEHAVDPSQTPAERLKNFLRSDF